MLGGLEKKNALVMEVLEHGGLIVAGGEEQLSLDRFDPFDNKKASSVFSGQLLYGFFSNSLNGLITFLATRDACDHSTKWK